LISSFDGRNGVSRESAALSVDVRGAGGEVAGGCGGGGGGSGLILPAFPQRRESFLYRPTLDNDLELIPRSLSRNLSAADQS